MLVEWEVIRRERDLVAQEEPQPPGERAGDPCQPRPPHQAVVNHDQIGAPLDRSPDQLGGRRHAGHHAVDLHRTFDLKAIWREVLEPIDLEGGVEVPDDLAQVYRHRPIVIETAQQVNGPPEAKPSERKAKPADRRPRFPW